MLEVLVEVVVDTEKVGLETELEVLLGTDVDTMDGNRLGTADTEH